MSNKVVLSQHMFIAIQGVERALRLLGHGEYKFKDATLKYVGWAMGYPDDPGQTYLTQINGRVYVPGQKPKKLKAEIYIRAYFRGSPAPTLDGRRAQILHMDGNEYRVFFEEKKRMSLHLWHTEENPVNPAYNPPKLKLLAEEQE